MPNPENILGKGNRFSSTNQPSNRGRKPKLYTVAKKSYGITFEEFKGVISYMMQCSKSELMEIARKDDTPMWMVNICHALCMDTKKGVLFAFKELTALMWGREMAAKVDITTNGKDIGREPLTIEIIDSRGQAEGGGAENQKTEKRMQCNEDTDDPDIR